MLNLSILVAMFVYQRVVYYLPSYPHLWKSFVPHFPGKKKNPPHLVRLKSSMVVLLVSISPWDAVETPETKKNEETSMNSDIVIAIYNDL